MQLVGRSAALRRGFRVDGLELGFLSVSAVLGPFTSKIEGLEAAFAETVSPTQGLCLERLSDWST